MTWAIFFDGEKQNMFFFVQNARFFFGFFCQSAFFYKDKEAFQSYGNVFFAKLHNQETGFH